MAFLNQVRFFKTTSRGTLTQVNLINQSISLQHSLNAKKIGLAYLFIVNWRNKIIYYNEKKKKKTLVLYFVFSAKHKIQHKYFSLSLGRPLTFLGSVVRPTQIFGI